MSHHNRTELFNLAKAIQEKHIKKIKNRTKQNKSPAHSSRLNFNIDNNNGSPSQLIGKQAENHAIQYLEDQGLLLLERNLLYKTGEIDIVMLDKNILVFIEVRLRNNPSYGNGLDSINKSKKLKIIRTAQYYLPYLVKKHFNYKTPACRFDAISITKCKTTWVKYAFETIRN